MRRDVLHWQCITATMPKLVASGLSEDEFKQIINENATHATAREGDVLRSLESSAEPIISSCTVPAGAEEPTAEKEPPALASSTADLFRFASRWDLCLSGLGLFFAVVQGAFMPTFALLVG